MSDALTRLTAALADRYVIERELGAGGMATVYLAEDLKHERKVAIKVLRPELAAVIGAERFLKEVKTTANLQHPHILGLIDSGESDSLLWYAMPYVDGESLRDRLDREKQLPVNDAVRLASEVAAALDYAHRHGVIHRDIKPENILLHDGSALVADFGIALAASTAGTRMTETGMSLGTPHYMSPEQAMGEREITPRSDVYALGCVTYEMLVGEPPFTGPTAQSIVAKVMTEKPAPLVTRRQRIPYHVEDAVLTALEKLPADRFATAAEFATALAAPGSTAASHASGRMRPAVSARSRRIRLGFALVGVTGLIAAAFLVGRGRGADTAFGQVAFDQRTWGHEAVFVARFTHDGQAVVYSAAPEGSNPQIFIIRPEYPTPNPIGDPGMQLLSVSSNDELAVLVNPVYLGFRLFTGTLARMPLGGGAPRELLTDVREADWSPDGSQLAIIREVGGKDRLEYPIGTVLYESAAGYLSDVRVSPTGDRVAFMEHPMKYDDRGVVGVVALDGTHQVLTAEYWGLEGVAWTREGDRILFAASKNAGFFQLHSVDFAGHDQLILPSAGTLTMHDVGMTGRWLIARDDEITRLLVKPPGVDVEQDYSWLNNTFEARLSGDGTLVAFGDASRDAGATYRTMLRKTDGSAAVALGEGFPKMVSHDKRWVLSVALTVPPALLLYPVGPGETRRLDTGELASYSDARFFPGDSILLICGNEPGHSARCYVRPLAGGVLRPITPEGTTPGAVISPDGQTVLARTATGYALYPVNGGTARAVPALASDDDVVRWSPDGRSLWITRDRQVPLKVEQLDLATGRRTVMMVLEPSNRAGIVNLSGLSLADDPRVYAYASVERVSQLFVVTGMQ